MPGINNLLSQVLEIHVQGRPDLFKKGTRKYTESELESIITDDDKPIFVATDENDNLLGYAFCIFIHNNSHILTDIKTLYIDDLCVDEKHRGKHIGSMLYDAVRKFAKQNNCYNLTLNVWSCNRSAMKFYEACGFRPQKVGMEIIL